MLSTAGQPSWCAGCGAVITQNDTPHPARWIKYNPCDWRGKSDPGAPARQFFILLGKPGHRRLPNNSKSSNTFTAPSAPLPINHQIRQAAESLVNFFPA
jgi:hypothetical protein